MPLQDLRVDTNGALYISADQLQKPCIIICSADRVALQPLHTFGTAEIITQDDHVIRIINRESIAFKGASAK